MRIRESYYKEINAEKCASDSTIWMRVPTQLLFSFHLFSNFFFMKIVNDFRERCSPLRAQHKIWRLPSLIKKRKKELQFVWPASVKIIIKIVVYLTHITLISAYHKRSVFYTKIHYLFLSLSISRSISVNFFFCSLFPLDPDQQHLSVYTRFLSSSSNFFFLLCFV